MAAAANDPGERGGSRAAKWLLAPPSCAAQHPARVRRAARLAEAVAAIRAAGGEAEAAVTDLRDEAQVERLIDGAVARHGRLDALVNDAAVGHIRPVAEGRSAEWRAVLETNVLGTLVACRAALRHMLPRGAGDIVNLTSASAHEAWPYLAAYSASKAAVHTLSR